MLVFLRIQPSNPLQKNEGGRRANAYAYKKVEMKMLIM